MRENRLSLSMFTLLKDVHLRLVQKSGLPAVEKLFYLANNNANIPAKVLRGIMRIIEANSTDIMQKWIEFFGEIQYYC